MARNSAFATFHLTRRLCVVGLLMALAVGCTMAPAPTRVDDRLAIHNVSVVNVADSSITPGLTVTVQKDRIVHVLPSVAQLQSWRERIANLSIVGPRIVAAEYAQIGDENPKSDEEVHNILTRKRRCNHGARRRFWLPRCANIVY